MTNKKNTRRALFMSIISLMLSVSMLVGTTFAWFTDSVVSGNNVIAAGNLDVELYHGKSVEPTDEVDGSDQIFTDFEGNLIEMWEPGVIAFTNLKVANVGTLALKYQMAINFTNMNYVEYEDGSQYTLADVLKVAVVEGGFDGEGGRVAAQELNYNYTLDSFGLSDVLEADETTKTYGVVIYWQPGDNDYDNLFNMNNGKTTNDNKPLRVDLGISLFATQEMYEGDSFGTDYDKGAAWTGEVGTVPEEVDGVITITSGAELAAFAADVNSGNTYKGKTVKLGANIDLNDIAWTPIGNSTNKFDGTFIGTGYTISNLYVTGTSSVGLFGCTWTSAHIEGVTIDGAYVSGNDYVGAILGSGYLSANCLKNNTVKNADIFATPYLMSDGVTYDGGAKAGAVAGYARNGSITGNTAINCTVSAYRDLGSIVGMVSGEDRAVAVSDNSANTVTLTYLDLNGAPYADGKVNENMGNIVGRINNVSNSTTLDADNTATDMSRETVITYVDNGIQYVKDVDNGAVTLYLVPDDYEGTTVNVPEGVTAIGGYAFAYNDNIETITLPSSVKTLNDRAFRDTSASTVVLNEGLTNISYQAFRNASNVTTVVIPSTVTTISKEAFQNSGITELIVPANVTTIEYGAMRDMKMLESVTIDSAADIPVYAFRACTNLKTVFLTNENVTFGGGSKGMIFTNKENGDGSAITVYVASEAVKTRLMEADTAAKDYGGYKIVVAESVSNSNALKDAVAKGGEVVVLPGTYTFPAGSMTKDTTLICSEDVVFEGVSSMDIKGATVIGATFDAAGNTNDNTGAGTGTINGTFKDCTFTGNHGLRYCYAGETVVFENCVFDADVRGIHFDAGANDVYFKNCIINGFNAIGSAITKAVFEGCTFGHGSTTYNGLNLYCNTELKDCKFIYTGTGSEFIDMEGEGKTLTITNCSATLNGEEISIQDKVGGSKIDKNTVILDGNKRVSDGLYTDDSGNYYVYNAAGLQSLKTWMDSKSNKDFWGKTYNIMADIDASTVTWNTKQLSPDSAGANGITFVGNGHTISNLTINGRGLFTGATKGGNSDVVTTFKDITFDNATVTGGTHHNGVIWGEAYGSLTLEKVSVINSKVSGGCNVGGLIGRNSESHATFTFIDCAVKNTTVEATQTSDFAGASAFLGMALHIGNSCSANVVFEGTNVAEGNTLNTANGMQGGGIYTCATWEDTTWETPVVVTDFTDYNSNKTNP